MLRPPMNKTVILHVPASSGETNRYGIPKKEPKPFKANVQEAATITDDTEGRDIELSATVCLPHDAPISLEMEIEYESVTGEMVKGKIKSIKGVKNLAGTRIFYWTVEVA